MTFRATQLKYPHYLLNDAAGLLDILKCGPMMVVEHFNKLFNATSESSVVLSELVEEIDRMQKAFADGPIAFYQDGFMLSDSASIQSFKKISDYFNKMLNQLCDWTNVQKNNLLHVDDVPFIRDPAAFRQCVIKAQDLIRGLQNTITFHMQIRKSAPQSGSPQP